MLDDFTAFDVQMFIWRAIVFLFTTALLIVADVIILRRKSLLDDNQLKSSSASAKIRLFIAILLYLAGVIIGVLAIYELITGNPNEWLVFKISFYVISWLAAVLFPFFSADSREALALVCVVVLFIIPIGMTIGEGGASESKEISKEILDSRTLVAVNDGVQEKGKAGSIIFFTTFAISEDGIYRYYWQDESGGIRRDSVDSDLTTIYYIKSEEQPHLDKITHVIHTFGTRNKRQYENIGYDNDVWYELYIPEGSIADSYSLDLQ